MVLGRVLCRPLVSKFRYYSSNATKLINVAIDENTGYTTVTLNKPPVNSLNVELLTEFSTILTDLEFNKSRGMILTSSAETVFSAGLDLMELYQSKPDRMRTFWTVLQDVWIKLYGSTFPTVAVINGHAPAGGCLLALSCEYRIMLPNYTIGLNETNLGIVAPTWFMKPMENAIGKRKTECALTTGKMFSTDEALQIGLVDALGTDRADCFRQAEAFLNQFEMISPLARSETKKCIRGQDVMDLVNNREADTQRFITGVQLPEVQQTLEFYLAVLKNKKE